jgi:S-adenosyl methyltransferase
MAAQSRAHSFDDPSIPHPARRYNYWLGGRENYRADRASGDAVAAAMPTIRIGIRENRAFLRRAVRFMVESGIRQFIDIGPGIPAPDCTHEVAQAIAPETRVVYVDNDQVVIAYSRALLRNNAIPQGAEADDGSIVDVQLPVFDFEDGGADADEAEDAGGESPRRGLIGHVLSDLCDPDRILQNAETRAVIDFTRPVGLLLVAVAHFCTDDATVYPAVAKLIEALPSGSIVAFSHVAADYVDPRIVARVDNAMADHNSAFRWRYTFECARFAHGLEHVEPGLVPIAQWRAEGEPEPRPTPAEVGICAWVARKP